MKRKHVSLKCKFSQNNWEYLQKEADRMETSISAIFRLIIRHVFEKRHYLKNMTISHASNKNYFKDTTLTVTYSGFEKLNSIICKRNDDNSCNSYYHADYVVSAYIELIEADLIKR